MDWLLALVDFILHIDTHLAAMTQTYGGWTYAILFVIIFCETGLVVTPLLPGDSLLFAAGALASLEDAALNVHFLAVLLTAAAILGDSVNYLAGRFLGQRAFERFPRVFRPEYLDRTNAFFARHGGKTIILARFVPIVRTFAPFVAGVGKMDYRRFLAFNVVGGVAWVVLFLYLGYVVGNLPFIQHNFTLVILGIIGVSLLPGLIEYLRARRSPPPTAP